ncbi:glycosyltransferase family 4 protein [Microbispora bryophytorum]|uniref:Glycosyl transferase n=1 Tax=Microbispora bryophytorum TaxID=1460882 RepID=A0A8H9H2J3_9ACTN|nr:glycosyltransferase family 4 protein [Microbispora bryophytorum]MBD3141229.1 glycosyltransferase family 4 protein [Microbispora bryophytorum]TQS04597.1 glycosyltransferase family 4 protein [Microbispora bryophytorum]GGO22954.1 glycosyl transferase [Microbispora bryophytorum]
MSRIVLVLGSSMGGVARHVRMLAGGLVTRGHRVLVAGPGGTEEAFSFTGTGAGFSEVEIADRPHPSHDLRTALRLRGLARGADVVHAHGLRAGALAALALTGSRGWPRLVVTLHNAVTAGGAIGVVYRLLERIVARRADRVLAISPDVAQRMRGRGARRVDLAVVPAPPLAEPARPAEDVRAEIATRLSGTGWSGAGLSSTGLSSTGLSGTGHAPQAAQERPILLTVARLAQQKGLETLLDAAAGPYKGDPVFVIAGDGPLREELQARVDAEELPVVLYGWAEPADLLQVATAVIVPSRWEGQPLSVQEALRAGRPIIATRVGGVPAMVGEAALLVPPQDPGALSREIGRLLGEPALAARLAQASERRGRELPDEDAALRAVLAAYGLAS